VILKEGNPEIIVADHKILNEASPSLYHFLCEHDLLIPLIIFLSSNAYEFKERKFPQVSAFVHKPFSIDSLSYLIKSITSQPQIKADYLSVKSAVLLNYIGKSFDLYLKLSETNFVKGVNRGEPFTKEDSKRFS
jgi:hypothetical protein